MRTASEKRVGPWLRRRVLTYDEQAARPGRAPSQPNRYGAEAIAASRCVTLCAMVHVTA